MLESPSKIFKNTKIAHRISLIVVIGITLLGIIGGVYLYGNAKINEQTSIQKNLHSLERVSNDIVKDIANIHVKSHDYLTVEQSGLLRDLARQQNSLLRNFAILKPLLAKTSLGDSIEILRLKVQTHKKLHTNIVIFQTSLGIDENNGIRGKLRSSIHRVEEILILANRTALTNKTLMMRRHEKNFMIRGGQKHVNQLDQRVAEFTRLIGMASSLGNQKAEIYRLIRKYQKHFHQFVSATNGINKQIRELDLIYQSTLSNVIEISDYADNELENSVSQVDTMNTLISHTLIGLIGLALALMSLAGLIIGQSIILPLNEISHISEALAANDTYVEIPEDVSQTEFGKINRALAMFRQHSIRLSQINGEMRTTLTKLQINEMAIARQNEQFDTAISNINQGLCLFDGDKKLIVSNDRYATIFNLSPDAIKPGMSIQNILQLRHDEGTFIDTRSHGSCNSADTWLSKFSEDVEILQLTDGRYIEFLFRPMKGGGWLATQEDVTNRTNAQLELMRSNEQIYAAITAMSLGISMYDKDQKIIISNDSYATIYGLDPGAIKSGMSLNEVMEIRIGNGCHVGKQTQEYRDSINNVVANRTGKPRIYNLSDGRIVEIRDIPMAEDGFLTIHEDVTERYEIEKKIKHLANYDTLTGLPNRAQIHVIIQNAVDQARADNTEMALLYIDLDGFKEVNDTLGHPVGDFVLNMVGSRLTDLADDNLFAGRLSGDEFIVVVKAFNNQHALGELANKLCEILAKPIHTDHNVIDISACIGIAIGPTTDGDIETLIQYSDLALYEAKANGSNSIRFFEEKMYAQAKKRQLMAANLRSAIQDDELLLHYQPQIDMRTRDIIGYEALVRWQHDEHGLVSPNQFIGLAEETGQISEIGEWVLSTACQYALTWPNEEKVSVNLSPVQFKRQDVVTMVKKVLWETGLDPKRLELEITENVLIQSTDSVIITLRMLAEAGVSIALDDFGTGYSSLSYLQTFPFNKIKIDKSFIDDLGKTAEATNIVSTIIGLGRSLNSEIVAEGVEKQSQHKLLRAAGCHQGQGFLYGKPMPQILEIDNTNILKLA